MGWNAAAVHAAGRRVEIALCHVTKRLRDHSLNRMRARDIAGRRRTEMSGGGEKSRVFARAIVVQRRLSFSVCREIARGFVVERRMRTASERGRRQAELGEPTLDREHVSGLAAVGCAGKRDLRIAQGKTSGSARLDQRQRLNHFDGRAGKDRAFHIPPGCKRVACRIHQGDGAAMKAFHLLAPAHLDQNRIAFRL
jgi:hypothetical protein